MHDYFVYIYTFVVLFVKILPAALIFLVCQVRLMNILIAYRDRDFFIEIGGFLCAIAGFLWYISILKF